MATLEDLVVAIGVDNSRVDQGTQQAESKFRKFADRVTKIAAVAGAAAGAALVAGLVKAMEFDRAQARMAAQLGDPALAEQLGRVAGDVYARGFGQSVDDAFSAVRAVTASGLVPSGDLAAIEDLTAAVQAYADAWGVDVVEAAQIASSLIGTGLARDATHAMDLITAASRKVPPALVDPLLEAANEYGQFFRTLGLNGEQAFSLLVSQAEKGQWGIDKVGDAIKEFTIRATDMSTATQEAFAAIGMDAQTMSNRLLAGGDTARQAFQEILAGLLSIKDPTDQATTALALFGTPLEDLNVAEIPQFLQSLAAAQNGLGDVSGAAQDAAEVLEQSASQKLESFKRRAQEALVDTLADAVPYIEATFGWLQRNSAWVKPLAVGLAALAAAIGTIIVVTKIWTAVQTALNVVMAMNPIVLIVLAVLALIAVIVLIATKTTWFQDIWEAVWGAVKAAALAVWDFLVAAFRRWWETFSGFWRGVGEFFGRLWDGIVNGVRAAWDWVTDRFDKAVTFMKGIPGKIRSGFSAVKDIVSSPFKAAFNAIASFWNRTAGRLSFTAPSWVPGIGGKGFSMPKLPMLADGGIVPATPGGTLAVIGEGRHDEAVIPLPRGLRDLTAASRQDRGPAGEVRVIVVGGDREAVEYLRRLDRQYGVA